MSLSTARNYLLGLLLILAGPIAAFPMIVETGTTIVIDHPVNEDIYLIAGTIMINAPIHGDVVVAGGEIYINDSVDRDVLIAGGTVNINGSVAGRVRCMGGRLYIAGNISGDLIMAGGEIIIERNAVISGAILATGGTLNIQGSVKGGVQATVNRLKLFGNVNRDLKCRAGTIEIDGQIGGATSLTASRQIIIGAGAAFNDSVSYWSPDQVDFGQAMAHGKPFRQEGLSIGGERWYFLGGAGFPALLWHLCTAMLVIVLLQYLLTSLFRKAGNKMYDNALRSFGTGFLFFVGMPFLILLAFISLVGIPVGLVLLFLYTTALLICGSFTAVVVANWFGNLMEGSDHRFWELVWMAMGAFVLLRLILSIPLFGWVLFPLLVCMAAGSVLCSIDWKRRKTRQHDQTHQIA
jgi:cytoskeletal protein CcmA (bactofilin family)